MNRALAEKRGRRAEGIAAGWLRLHGWRILAKRVRTTRGEVDIVAKRRKMVAFVEVKARSNIRDLDLSIDQHRLKRVAAAAEILYSQFCKNGEDARIDVILVAPRRWPTHLTNVWHGF